MAGGDLLSTVRQLKRNCLFQGLQKGGTGKAQSGVRLSVARPARQSFRSLRGGGAGARNARLLNWSCHRERPTSEGAFVAIEGSACKLFLRLAWLQEG